MSLPSSAKSSLTDRLRALIAQREQEPGSWGFKGELAKAAGVSASRVTALINKEHVSLDVITKIAAAFNIETELVWLETNSLADQKQRDPSRHTSATTLPAYPTLKAGDVDGFPPHTRAVIQRLQSRIAELEDLARTMRGTALTAAEHIDRIVPVSTEDRAARTGAADKRGVRRKSRQSTSR